MKIHTLLNYLLLFACGSTLAHTATIRTEQAAIEYALSNNPNLRAARQVVDIAKARHLGAGRLSNPELGATVAGGDRFEGRIELGLTQRFPLTNRLRLEKEISQLELEAASWEIAKAERELRIQVRQAFLDLASAHETVALRKQQNKISQSFADTLEKFVKEGFTSHLDQEQASLEALGFLIATKDASAEIASYESTLARLLGLSAENLKAIGNPVGLALPKSLPARRALAKRPEIRLAEIAFEAAQKDISLARAMRWEDIALTLFVEAERDPESFNGIAKETLLGLSVSLPLPLWQSTKAAVQERQAIADQRALLLEALERISAQEAQTTWKEMQARFAAAELLQNKAIPLVSKLLTETQAAYDRGEIGSENLFRIRQRKAEIEFDALQQRLEFHRARAAWLNATGTPVKPIR